MNHQFNTKLFFAKDFQNANYSFCHWGKQFKLFERDIFYQNMYTVYNIQNYYFLQCIDSPSIHVPQEEWKSLASHQHCLLHELLDIRHENNNVVTAMAEEN